MAVHKKLVDLVYERHLVAPLLARHFRVSAPDLIGLGDTLVRLNDDCQLPQTANLGNG